MVSRRWRSLSSLRGRRYQARRLRMVVRTAVLSECPTPENLYQKHDGTVVEVLLQARGRMRWWLRAWRCVWICGTALIRLDNSSMSPRLYHMNFQPRSTRASCAWQRLYLLYRICYAGSSQVWLSTACCGARAMIVQMPVEKPNRTPIFDINMRRDQFHTDDYLFLLLNALGPWIYNERQFLAQTSNFNRENKCLLLLDSIDICCKKIVSLIGAPYRQIILSLAFTFFFGNVFSSLSLIG